MRRWIEIGMLAIAGWSAGAALAQTAPLLRVVARHVPMDVFELVSYALQCPAGHIPVDYRTFAQYPYDVNEEQLRDLTDRNQAVLSRSALTSAAQIDGGGFALTVYNTEHHEKSLEGTTLCLSAAASSDNSLRLVRVDGAANRQATVALTAFCPAEAPAALGGFSSAEGRLFQDVSSAPVWGTSASPIALTDQPDGTTGAPTGWRMQVFNNLSPIPAVTAFAVCGKAPTLQTIVYSVPTVAGRSFSLFGPVPDGFNAVGRGFEGGLYGLLAGADTWIADGTIPSAQQWYDETRGYDSGSSPVRAFLATGVDIRQKATALEATSRAVLAVLAVPLAGTAPPPTVLTIIEYYNAALNHYFITGIADEIAKLDNHVFRGWARTGESFRAYGPGSSGRTGRRPVCRVYGRPEYNLDSHFYSASPDECNATLVNLLNAWAIESSEVFEMDLPEPITGACPPGGVPVYRIWNQRRDSNHRYTTSKAIRDEMVARGGVAEGYGLDAVALCGLP